MLHQSIPLPRDLPRPKEQILVNITPQETRVAVLEDAVVQELHVERAASRGIVGNIYLGQVKRVLPGMQSAFIEIGLGAPPSCTSPTCWSNASTRPSRNASKKCCSKARPCWCR